MKDFFKDKTLEDYLLMLLISIIALGGVLFIIGYFWGFSTPLNITAGSGKTTIKQITSGKSIYFNTIYGEKISGGVNLFKLMGMMDASWGTAYGMCITAIVGFSLMMLAVAIIIMILIAGLIIEVIIPKIKK